MLFTFEFSRAKLRNTIMQTKRQRLSEGSALTLQNETNSRLLNDFHSLISNENYLTAYRVK
jgi:hypothetical protein